MLKKNIKGSELPANCTFKKQNKKKAAFVYHWCFIHDHVQWKICTEK